MNDELRRAKQPANALAGRYGHPVHPMLVTVPIGAWVASLVFDIGSRVADDPGSLTRGSEWLILIGVIGAVLAACAGFLDRRGIAGGTPAAKTVLIHLSLNISVTVLYFVNFLWRHASYPEHLKVSIGQIVLSLVSLAALGASGYLGGKLAYRYGVRVADESVQAEGFAQSGRGGTAQ
jgi:uncharacterized membrane protein